MPQKGGGPVGARGVASCYEDWGGVILLCVKRGAGFGRRLLLLQCDYGAVVNFVETNKQRGPGS